MKKYKLPKDTLIQPRDGGEDFIDDKDVEGHGLPITPPPGFEPAGRTPHGGEAVPTDDDNEAGPNH